MSATTEQLPATGAPPAATAASASPAAKPTEKETEQALIEAMKELFDAGKEMETDIKERCERALCLQHEPKPGVCPMRTPSRSGEGGTDRGPKSS